MMIEDPAALRFFMTSDIYLLKTEASVLVKAGQTTAPAEVTTPATVFNYMGGNKQGFVVLCHYEDVEVMDDKHLEALKNTLLRKQLSFDDVALLNMAGHADLAVDELIPHLKPARLLLLGKNCLLKGWDNLSLNQLQTINGLKVLYTHSFTEMMGDRDKTKVFWEQMKLL